jgi:hypothetical protein
MKHDIDSCFRAKKKQRNIKGVVHVTYLTPNAVVNDHGSCTK